MPLQFLLLQHWDFCIMSNFMFNSSNSKIVTNEEMEATDYFNVQMAPLMIQWDQENVKML